ncbi:MAG: hypothetical protein ABIF77_07845 [bacterium]
MPLPLLLSVTCWAAGSLPPSAPVNITADVDNPMTGLPLSGLTVKITVMSWGLLATHALVTATLAE